VRISIGDPIANTQIYLLDSKLQPVPVGVAGELYIGGDGLARGYLKQPALTAEKFIPDPFTKGEGARLYRTGDLARRIANGGIEFLGRVDNQVKLRGFRIELGEIESVLNQYSGVTQCVVVLRGESADNLQLVAYVIPEQGTKLENSELRTALAERLPGYMVPSTFVQIDRLPLTPNGKVDRKSLPNPDKSHQELASVYVAPRDIPELWLTEIWEQILDVKPVSVTDNFFELGGHSLLAVRLMGSIKERWGNELPLTTLFQYPTIEKIAGLLRKHEEVYSSPLVGLQTGGSRRPLFLVHPIGGSVFHYFPLRKHLGPDQPLYGLQSVGLDTNVPPLVTVEEMAARYLEALRTVQPEGPYLLGGWSMGGLIAYEMAQQLQAKGEAADLLVLIDSVAPRLQKKLDPNDEPTVLRSFAGLHGIRLQNLGTNDEALEEVFEQAKAARLIPADIDITRVRQLLNVFRSNLHAMQDYVPRQLETRVHLISTTDPIDRDLRDPALGWTELAREVLVTPVEGSHFTILLEPQVAVIAEHLNRWLTQAQCRVSSFSRG
jgi:thioesterase domain-containing protein/acyl carrier protein